MRARVYVHGGTADIVWHGQALSQCQRRGPPTSIARNCICPRSFFPFPFPFPSVAAAATSAPNCGPPKLLLSLPSFPAATSKGGWVGEVAAGAPSKNSPNYRFTERGHTPAVLYYEDLEIAKTYGSSEITVNENEVIEFAKAYDPQPFHTDKAAAKESVFGMLVASGWHTAALTMRLRVTGELQLAGGWIGLGIESMKWPKPVLPGDTLHATFEVIEKRESKSNPSRGIIRVRTCTYNQRGESVFETVSVQIVLKRLDE